MDDRVLRVNVGGSSFIVYRELLSKYPASKLALLNPSDQCFIKETREYFIDTNPAYFNVILDVYRDGNHGVCFGKDTPVLAVLDQLDYWGLDTKVLSPHERQRCVSELNILNGFTHLHPKCEAPVGNRGMMYKFLEMPSSSCGAVIYAVIYYLLVATSLVVFMLETMPEFKSYRIVVNNATAPSVEEIEEIEPFILIPTLITLLLLVDLSIRFITSPYKLEFCKDFYNLTDAFGIIPDVFVRFLQFSTVSFGFLEFAAILILFRSFRFVKLISNFVATRQILCAAWESVVQIVMWFVCFSVSLIIFANLVYFAEIGSRDSHFRSSVDALWWAIVTLTTVGYGDQRPISMSGKVIGGLSTVFGVLFVAMAAAIFSNNLRRIQGLSLTIPACNDCEMRRFNLKINKLIQKWKQTGNLQMKNDNIATVAAQEQTALL